MAKRARRSSRRRPVRKKRKRSKVVRGRRKSVRVRRMPATEDVDEAARYLYQKTFKPAAKEST